MQATIHMRPTRAKCGPGMGHKHFGHPRALHDKYAEMLEIDNIVLGHRPQQHLKQINSVLLFGPFEGKLSIDVVAIFSNR